MKPIGKKDFQALVKALMENNAKLATKIIQENPELVPRLVKEQQALTNLFNLSIRVVFWEVKSNTLMQNPNWILTLKAGLIPELLEQGVDLNSTDALYFSATRGNDSMGNLKVVRMLLEAGVTKDLNLALKDTQNEKIKDLLREYA